MQFSTITSPHTDRPNSIRKAMLWVILALIPGGLGMIWFFGWGILINMVIAITTAVLCEALVMKLRGRRIKPVISDLSAVLTAMLFAIAVPPLLPWWLTVLGMAFAILLVKQAYGGLGYNVFNPAMAAYVLLLISYPVQMTSWLPPVMLNENPMSFLQTLGVIFGGSLPGNLTWDAVTMATPLDTMRTGLSLNQTVSEVSQSPVLGYMGGKGWEIVAGLYLLGGIFMLYKKAISWHIPVSVLGSLALMALIFNILDADAYPFSSFHLFSGAAMLGAFFIATDPVSAPGTRKGQLYFGAGIGILVYIIRTWGGYPDAIAFSVLLMNMAAPTIEFFTRPRTFGHRGSGND
ncbi:MAG: electron transport complex subunit RsxD [Gammaproteobacteria bacterium]